MKIALGTTSNDKRLIVEESLKKNGLVAEIIPCSVDSMITDQPLDEATTITGAKNRAINALKKIEDADAGMGLEGGLVEIDGFYYLVCVAAIVNKNGTYSLGVSSKLALPKYVSQGVMSGGQFGELIRKFQNDHLNNTELNEVIEKLLTRKMAFFEAISNAVLQFKNLNFY